MGENTGVEAENLTFISEVIGMPVSVLVLWNNIIKSYFGNNHKSRIFFFNPNNAASPHFLG